MTFFIFDSLHKAKKCCHFMTYVVQVLPLLSLTYYIRSW